MKKILIVLVFLFLIMLSASRISAEEINSRAVTYMDLTITKGGTINLKSQTDNAFSNHIKVFLNMPQINGMQTRRLISVEGPDEHEVSVDEWGNDILMLKWNKPPVGKDLSYEIVYNVKLGKSELEGKRMKPPTSEYTRPNEDIMQIAYSLKRDTDIETLFEINRWVYENVKYDLEYTQSVETASWVCENRKGTCDEFSNLAIALLNALDYNAWYSAGWAYSGKGWEPHAWVKVYLEDKTVGMDPTWLEYPIDATHVEFTTIPDSNNTEYVQSEGSGYKIIWTKSDVRLEINEYNKENITKVTANVLDDDMKGGSYGVITAFVEAEGCHQGTLTATSCTREDGNPLLEFLNKEKHIGFCGSESFNFFFRSSSTGSMFTKYSCPVVISTSEGDRDIVGVAIEGTAGNPDLYVSSTDSIVVGSRIEVLVKNFDSGTIYTDFNGETQTKDVSGEDAEFFFESPDVPGKYQLIVFADSGALETREITVLSNRVLQISKIEVPSKADLGDNVTINVTIAADSTSNGYVELIFGSHKDKQEFSILGSSRREFTFPISLQEAGKKDISVKVFTDIYQDGWAGSLKVESREQAITDGAKDILSMILDFFIQLGEMIENLLGL
ncbi:MAG: transglutaminase domain-containing protein [Candidatus Aenigmarchaeota archaeon]|nr:transglutaminase domain-containing protein [Candidatus Aenigmarchaeota archaeon]